MGKHWIVPASGGSIWYAAHGWSGDSIPNRQALICGTKVSEPLVCLALAHVGVSNPSFIRMVTENQNFVQCPDLCDVRSLPIVDIENVKVSRFKAVWERQPLGGCFGRTLTVRTRLAPLLVASMVFECCMTNLSMLPCASIHAFPPVSQTVACTRLRHVNAE